MVHVRKLLFKKYMKNHNIYIYIYFNKVEEKKITQEELIPLLGFQKKYWGLHCFYSVHD